MLISAAVSQTPLPNLYLSLVFGVGQAIVGPAMLIYAARKERWRQITFFVLALIGAWVATSGITELVVSGTELLARLGGNISAASFQYIRANADTVLLYVSLALLAIGVAYLLFAGRWRTTPTRAAPHASKASDVSKGQAAEVPAPESED